MARPLAIVVAVSAVIVGVLAAGLRPDAFYVGDPGVKLVAARHALRSPGSPFSLPLPVIGPTPAPHVSPFFAVHDDHAHAVTSELFPVASAPLLGAFGLRGLYVWPIAGLLGALLATARVARTLDPRRSGALAAVLLLLGTPLLFYGLEFWEHAPAVALGWWSATLLLDASGDGRVGRRHAGRALAAGGLAGLAVLLRPEAAWFGLAFLIATPLLPSRQRPTWQVLAWGGAGALLTVLPLEAHTWFHFGSIAPPHVATNAGLLGERWLAARGQLATTWFLPSAWGLRGPANPASLFGVSTAAVAALASTLRPPARANRGFLFATTAIYALLVLLTAPNDGGGQWGPRYLLFACVPLAILAADLVEPALVRSRTTALGDPRDREGREGDPVDDTPVGRLPTRPRHRRPLVLGLAALLLVASVWVQRAGYRQVRGTRQTYGRIVDFVGAHLTKDRQVVTDIWWLDQLAASALDGQNVLYAGDAEAGHGIVRRLSEVTMPTVTVFRSLELVPSVDDWTSGTCYFEEGRDHLPVRGLVAIRLTHRCGYTPDAPPSGPPR